jgi:hypothetical protein
MTDNEQESLDLVNAVGRNAASPGVGAPGSTAATDAGNVGVASAMDKADLGNRYGFGSLQYKLGADAPTDVLRARRDPQELIDSAIQLHRERLDQINAGVDPDANALALSPKLRAARLHQELAVGEQLQRDAQIKAAADLHLYRQQKDVLAATQVSGMVNALSKVQSDPGTPEHEKDLITIAGQFPEALHTQEGREIFHTQTTIHDSTAKMRQADTSTENKEYLDMAHQVGEYGKTRGVSPVFDPESGMPSMDLTRQYADGLGHQATSAKGRPEKTTDEKAGDLLEHGLLSKYGITPEQFANPVSVKAGKLDGKKNFTNQYTGAEKGDKIQIDTGQGEVTMSRKDFDQFQRLHGAAGDSATPASTPKKVFKYNPATGDLE